MSMFTLSSCVLLLHSAVHMSSPCSYQVCDVSLPLCPQILMHMEDRLQEMFFKSRMLSEYIKSRKKVDMDELDAMFG